MSARMHTQIVAAVFASLMIVGLAGRVGAEDRCSVASLKGPYAFRVDGTVIASPGFPPGPFVAIGRTTYDGKGNIHGVIVASLDGSITPSLTSGAPFTFAGTYTVKADCTGSKSATLNIGATLDFDFVIDSNLREIQFIATNPGTALSGSARKLFTDREQR